MHLLVGCFLLVWVQSAENFTGKCLPFSWPSCTSGQTCGLCRKHVAFGNEDVIKWVAKYSLYAVWESLWSPYSLLSMYALRTIMLNKCRYSFLYHLLPFKAIYKENKWLLWSTAFIAKLYWCITISLRRTSPLYLVFDTTSTASCILDNIQTGLLSHHHKQSEWSFLLYTVSKHFSLTVFPMTAFGRSFWFVLIVPTPYVSLAGISSRSSTELNQLSNHTLLWT